MLFCRLYWISKLHYLICINPSTSITSFDWDQLAKIHQCGWKGLKKISKDAKFEHDSWKSNKVIAPKSRRFLGFFAPPPPPSIQTSVTFCDFIWTVSLLACNASPLNLVSVPILRHSLQQYQWIFANWSSSKLEEKETHGMVYSDDLNYYPDLTFYLFLLL